MKNYSTTISLVTLALALCISINAHALELSDSDLLRGDAAEHIAALNQRLIINTPWRQARDQAIAAAIDPDDYECDSETDFRLWVDEIVAEVDPITLDVLSFLEAFDMPSIYGILFDNDASDAYIGVNGEYTRELIKRHKDNQRFWDVPTDDILLLGMHGAMIADDAKMLPLVQLLFGFPDPAINQYIVDTIQGLIEGGDVDLSLIFGPGFIYSAPGIPGGYNHPLFTLNAFAFSDQGVEIIPGFGLLPDKIVMGEGILEGYDAIGMGANAPDVIHAHEFAHHVQYELGVFALPVPEETRRIELMADAFGAYYSSHARGATFQAKRFADVMNASYVIGDCDFSDPGHHGTPNQREAAAIWGGDVSASARKQGHINSATLMLDLFEAELPNLVAPDAE